MKGWSKILRWPMPLTVFWLLVPFLVLSVAVLARATPPHDYWWHLVIGRYIDSTGEIPRHNLWLYTLPPNAPFIDQPWLGQLAMFWTYRSAGHLGPALMLTFCVFATWFCIVAAGLRRTDNIRAVGALASVAALLSSATLLVRTQMFAFVTFAVVLTLLFEVFEGRLRRSWLLLTVVVTALWANLHGTFVLAPLLAGAFTLATVWEVAKGYRPRRDLVGWGLTVVLLLLAGIASPLGTDNLRYLVSYSQIRGVTEWQAPSPVDPAGALTWLCVIGGAALLFRSRKQARVHHFLLYALLAGLALSSKRSGVWWALALPFTLAPAYARWPAREDTPTTVQGVLNALFACATVAAIVAMQPGVLAETLRARGFGDALHTGAGAGLLSVDSPVGLVRRVAERPTPPRLFHEQRIGGLLELELSLATDPKQVAFVDQRIELIPEAIWEQYFQLSDGKQVRLLFERWSIEGAIVHTRAQAGLFRALSEDPDYVEADREGEYVLFLQGEQPRAMHP